MVLLEVQYTTAFNTYLFVDRITQVEVELSKTRVCQKGRYFARDTISYDKYFALLDLLGSSSFKLAFPHTSDLDMHQTLLKL